MASPNNCIVQMLKKAVNNTPYGSRAKRTHPTQDDSNEMLEELQITWARDDSIYCDHA
jgi:hypothetical protein